MLVSECVQKGIELFKSDDPYWFEKVDISVLRVELIDCCPAAQIYGGFSTFVERYHMSTDALWEHGLLTSCYDGKAVHNPEELDMEWKKRILYLNIERRIDKGISLLDSVFVFDRVPWFMRVKTDVIHISSNTSCVLAQSLGFEYGTCERLIFASSLKDGYCFPSFIGDCNTFFVDRGFLVDASRLNVDVDMLPMMIELYNHIWRIKIQDKCIEYQKIKEDSLA